MTDAYEEIASMISVIITTCRRPPDVVERAIRSVIVQTNHDWELLIVDDSPESYEKRNEVREMVLRYAADHPITYLSNEANSGACYSRNRGLGMARGEYVAFLDDDDEWLPQKLALQAAALDRAPDNAALVYCRSFWLVVGEGYRKLGALDDHPQEKRDLYDALMRYGNFVGGMSFPMMRTACVRQVDGFDSLMQAAQDYDLWLRLSVHYSFIALDEPLVVYYQHNDGSITGNPAKRIAGIERLIQKNSDYLNKHSFQKWKRLISLCPYYVQMGETDRAFCTWLQAVKLCPVCIIQNTRELLRIIVSK